MKFFLLASLYFFFTFSVVHGAEFSMEADSSTFGTGEQFMVTIFVDTEGQPVNAFEGRVLFPEDLIALRGVRELESIVSLWIQEPPVFSALTPGGYEGKGVLFSLIFETKQAGQGLIQIANARALLSDGKGTPALVRTTNFPIVISESISPTQELLNELEDIEPPESFEVRLTQDPSIYEGKPFLVFSTQDKNSGVSHYEISFVSNGQTTGWERATSPYLLTYENAELVVVKAVDRAGNERVSSLQLQDSSSSFILLLIIGILLGTVGLYWTWQRKKSFS